MAHLGIQSSSVVMCEGTRMLAQGKGKECFLPNSKQQPRSERTGLLLFSCSALCLEGVAAPPAKASTGEAAPASKAASAAKS